MNRHGNWMLTYTGRLVLGVCAPCRDKRRLG